jgi:chromosome segregation ATPase
MKRTILFATAACLVGLPSLAAAQGLRMGRHQQCDQQKAEIANMKTQVDSLDAEAIKVADRVMKIRRRLQEFEQKRADMARERKGLTERIKAGEAEMARRCRGMEACARLDQRVDDLQNRLNPIHQQLRAVRDEIRREIQQISTLNQDVNRISNQYQQLNCENLVPGQTAQSTVDRCHALFSEWNAAATRINQLEASLRNLRGRYQGLMAQTQNINREIAQLRNEMRKDCSDSQRYAVLEQLDRDRGEYDGLKSELDTADSNVGKLRLLKIAPAKPKPGLRKAN